MAAACKQESSLNAWFDSHSVGRRVLEKVDIAVATDTKEGLFTPVLRDVANRDAASLDLEPRSSRRLHFADSLKTSRFISANR